LRFERPAMVPSSIRLVFIARLPKQLKKADVPRERLF
jgi:hypothetical protein